MKLNNDIEFQKPKLNEATNTKQKMLEGLESQSALEEQEYRKKMVYMYLDWGTGMSDSLGNAYENGEDPVKGLLSQYQIFEKDISDMSISDQEKSKHHEALDHMHDMVVRVFAKTVANNLMDPMYQTGSDYHITHKRDRYSREEYLTLTNDIVNMFKKAKSYYDAHGNIDGMDYDKLSNESSTITYSDLLKLHKLKDMKGQILNTYVSMSENFGLEKNKIIREYFTQRAERVGLSDYSVGLFMDMYL
jgi:hypothetical protein